jgi:hypothetical protein
VRRRTARVGVAAAIAPASAPSAAAPPAASASTAVSSGRDETGRVDRPVAGSSSHQHLRYGAKDGARLVHIRLCGKRRISRQALQITQRLTGDDGRDCESNVTTGNRIEHSQRHLRYTRRLEWIECAAQNDLAVLLYRVENPHRTSVPWVPAIKNFPRLGNMGVVLTACTTARGATRRLGMKLR